MDKVVCGPRRTRLSGEFAEGRRAENGRKAAEEAILGSDWQENFVTLPDGRHLALAIFVADSTASDQTRHEVIARLARAAWDSFASNARQPVTCCAAAKVQSLFHVYTIAQSTTGVRSSL